MNGFINGTKSTTSKRRTINFTNYILTERNMAELKRGLLTSIRKKDIARLAKSGEKLLTQVYDETSELYNRILRFSRPAITTDDFLELVYDMLIAFKMNSRGAKLSAFADFKKTIAKQADIIQSLAKYKLEKVKATDDTFIATIDCA